MNSNQDKELVKPTKGFLYEIRTKKNELVGYLFGTQHKLGIKELEHLHPKILSRFDKASHVLFELDDLFANDDTSMPPIGVEHFLYRRGVSQGKKFGGLETELSREKISKKLMIEDEFSYYNVKAQGILVIVFGQLLSKYNQLVELTNNIKNTEDISALVEGVSEVLPLAVYIIKNQIYFPQALEDNLFKIFDEITKLTQTLGLRPDNSNNFLKEKMLAQREKDENHLSNKMEDEASELSRKYVEGNDSDEGPFTQSGTTHLEIALNKCKDEIRLKEIQERDAIMAETIHNDLQLTLLNPENRCGFYAPGAHHVIGKYPNSLPKLLEEKGWVLNKVELPSVLQLEDKSSLNDTALSQNGFFSINLELLKPGRELVDHTRADPYGPGAIVPYRGS